MPALMKISPARCPIIFNSLVQVFSLVFGRSRNPRAVLPFVRYRTVF
jgi:hypothetical protein